MSDLIRRADAIKAVTGWDECPSDEELEWAINRVPTVEPIEWILCSERLPEKYGEYLITTTYLDESYVTTDEYFSYGWDDWGRDVVAWAERPKPWKGIDDDSDNI